MDIDDALAIFLDTNASYGGGLSNHGPMAVEALAHLGVPEAIGPFVEHYRSRLDCGAALTNAAPDAWPAWLRPRLAALVPNVASGAGHGLLRVAHAVRGLERTESNGGDGEVQRRELGAAVAYWSAGGAGLDGPDELRGDLTAEAWVESLDRRGPQGRSEGLLTANFVAAAKTPQFASRVAALAAADDPATNLDELGAAAAVVFRRNVGASAFATLHATTVPAMASVLVPYLDTTGQKQLVAAVATFVAAAVVAYDDQLVTPDVGPVPGAAELAVLAGATKDDHTIKFTDACISIAARTGDPAPRAAAFQQIQHPYGE